VNNKALATATLLLATMGAGCTGSIDKSGGEKSPTTLVLASSEGTGVPPAIEHFVQLVHDESDGRLRIDASPGWQAKGEQRVLEDVAAGKAELGWSGTRAFDLIGVNTFQPLHAPFLVSSYAAERAVLGDAVAQDMLAGLRGSGLVGLALLADELRFPAAAEAPLLHARDFDGLVFGVMPSKVQSAAMTALGARVEPLRNLASTGMYGLEGAETMWSTYTANGQDATVPFVTANATLWPRTTVMVANSHALDGLSGDDRDVLNRAAAEAARWSLEHAEDKVDGEIAQACDRGARIALASPHQLTVLARAGRPVYDALRAERQQADVLNRIEQLVDQVGSDTQIDVPQGCAYQAGDGDRLDVRALPAPIDGPGRPGRLPAGTYRYSLTEDEIRHGSGMDDEGYAAANSGVWTWTLGDGRWSYVLKQTSQEVPEDTYGGTTCAGYYDVHGNRVDFTTVTVPVSGDCASTTWKADWRETGSGLAMDVTTDSDDLDFLFGAKTWERIG
jgi:TRAP-type C4-dicarboxylate transport system substrate-binding protein